MPSFCLLNLSLLNYSKNFIFEFRKNVIFNQTFLAELFKFNLKQSQKIYLL